MSYYFQYRKEELVYIYGKNSILFQVSALYKYSTACSEFSH